MEKKVKGKEWENRFIIALSRIFICWRTKKRGSSFIFQKLTGKHQFSAAATDEFPDNRFAAPLVVVHLLFFSSPQHEFLFFGESVVSTWAAKCSAFKSERRSLVENKSTPPPLLLLLLKPRMNMSAICGGKGKKEAEWELFETYI